MQMSTDEIYNILIYDILSNKLYPEKEQNINNEMCVVGGILELAIRQVE